jgi:hypothetical protein
MTPPSRKWLSEALTPIVPQDVDWEPARSTIATRVPDFED